MKLVEFRNKDPEFQRFIVQIRAILDRLDLDNFRTEVISGTTADTADTEKVFRIQENSAPIFWIVQGGDVYIPTDGVSPREVNVQSRLASQNFKILLFF